MELRRRTTDLAPPPPQQQFSAANGSVGFGSLQAAMKATTEVRSAYVASTAFYLVRSTHVKESTATID
jgi:hypothetical protein